MTLMLCLTGCSELVHWGHVSDRENSFGVNDVEIAQREPDGAWKTLGRTDGKGRWEILKDRVSGGGDVRLRKPGYETVTMPESEFLQQNVILMQSQGDMGEQDWMGQ